MTDSGTLAVAPQLALRTLQEADAEALFACIERNRVYLREWLPWLDSNTLVADSRRFISSAQNNRATGEAEVFAVIWHGELVGTCSLDAMDRASGTANIGYWLSEAHTGQGLMTRCAQRLLRFGFTERALGTVTLNVAEGNLKSIAIAQRLGFQCTRKVIQAEDLYGVSVNHLRYTLNDSDFMDAMPHDPGH